jgi:hypothetical protein
MHLGWSLRLFKEAIMAQRLLLSVVLALAVVFPGFSADDARFALVIGNAAYDGEAALANSCNDANDMAAALTSIGWRVTKVIDGDRKTMNRAVATFRDLLAGSRNATALLFYAGHGIQIGGTNYLIPVKENFESPDDVVSDAVSLQTILNAFDDAKVATNIVILDACRDNPFVKKNSRSLGGSRGLTVVNKSPNVEGSAVLFSTAPGDTAADGKGRNGVFTQALLKYITTDISLQLLATKVTGDVKKVTGGKQTPYSSLSLSDEFFMVPASMRTKPAPVAADVPTLAEPTAPAASTNPALKASLVVQKESLMTERQKIRDQRSWVGWMGIAGWSLAVLGGGASGYGWYTGSQAVSAYNSSTSQSGFDAARSQMADASRVYSVGLGTMGVGLAVGITSLFLGPDTSNVDKKIQDVDKQITLLGGN